MSLLEAAQGDIGDGDQVQGDGARPGGRDPDRGVVVNTRVLVAEGHRLVRGALVRLLAAHPDVDVVAEVENGEQALATTLALQPDVALLAVDLNGLDAVEVFEQLRRRGSSAGVLLLSRDADAAAVQRALTAGVRGYVQQDDSVEELLTAIQRVAAGHRHLSPAAHRAATSPGAVTAWNVGPGGRTVPAGPWDRAHVPGPSVVVDLDADGASDADVVRLPLLDALTPREQEVLAGLAEGRSAEAIAAELVVSLATVRSHIRAVLQKLEVNSQVAAVALAWRSGWAAQAVAGRLAAASGSSS